MRQIQSVGEFWASFNDWLKANGYTDPFWHLPPASEAAISRAEEMFGFPLPSDVKEFYRHHDGSNFWPWNEGCCSLQEALEIAQMRRDIVRTLHTEYPDSAEDLWWADDWFPFVEDGGGNGDAVQCLGAQAGHMAFFNHEWGGEPKEESFLTYLGQALNDLNFYHTNPLGGAIPRNELSKDHPAYFDGDIEDWRASQAVEEEP